MLDAKEERSINFNIFGPEEYGLYKGSILVNDIIVPISIQIGEALFDINLEIPEHSKVISSKEGLSVLLTLIPAEGRFTGDVVLNYTIKNFDGGIFLNEKETMYVDSIKSFKKDFSLVGIESGDYYLETQLIYTQGIAVASDSFKVRNFDKFRVISIILWIIFINFIILLLALIFYFLIKRLIKRDD